jgi:hypothetical protein
VVNGSVEAELLGQDRALLGPTGDAEDAGALTKRVYLRDELAKLLAVRGIEEGCANVAS